MLKYCLIGENSAELYYNSCYYKTREDLYVDAYAHREALESIVQEKIKIVIEECK